MLDEMSKNYFENQCLKCKFGDYACPVYIAVMIYEKQPHECHTSLCILNTLVKSDGKCTMFEQFEKTLKK